MLTLHRAEALAEAAAAFPILGEIGVTDLLETVRLELGHEAILDGFQPYGRHMSRAVPIDPILHIVSGNTPHAALQSLLRGLLLGARNFVKLPSSGLPEVEEFLSLLPEALRSRAQVAYQLPDEWLRKSRAWIVFGSDETVAHFRKLARPGIVFAAHPHRLSLCVVFDDPGFESLPFAARDVSLFDQKGCLSPHDIYVAGDARAYAERLAVEMARVQERIPRSPISREETAQIADLRANYTFRAANDPRVQIWQSEGSTDWTVIFEDDPWFAASCLNRLVFVKPLPEDLSFALDPVRGWLAGAGIWPATPENAAKISPLGFSRICQIGRMQEPPFSWHQEGIQSLAHFVQWVDFEP